MTRKWCLRGRKNYITKHDPSGHTQSTYKRGAHFLDCNLRHCGHFGPDGDLLEDGEEPCFDPENLWCIPNDVPIYEAKRLWWKKAQPRIDRNLNYINKAIINLNELFYNEFGFWLQTDDLSIVDKSRFLRGIRKRVWNDPEDEITIRCYLKENGLDD